jgi:hypothetical protein
MVVAVDALVVALGNENAGRLTNKESIVSSDVVDFQKGAANHCIVAGPLGRSKETEL